jgi:hypothetical protein
MWFYLHEKLGVDPNIERSPSKSTTSRAVPQIWFKLCAENCGAYLDARRETRSDAAGRRNCPRRHAGGGPGVSNSVNVVSSFYMMWARHVDSNRGDTATRLHSLGPMSSVEKHWSEACWEARNKPLSALLDSMHASFGFTVSASRCACGCGARCSAVPPPLPPGP